MSNITIKARRGASDLYVFTGEKSQPPALIHHLYYIIMSSKVVLRLEMHTHVCRSRCVSNLSCQRGRDNSEKNMSLKHDGIRLPQ